MRKLEGKRGKMKMFSPGAILTVARRQMKTFKIAFMVLEERRKKYREKNEKFFCFLFLSFFLFLFERRKRGLKKPR